MSKRTTRLLSLILTLVMFLSVATPAYAWGPGDFGGGWDRDIGDDEVRDPGFEVEEEEEEYDYFQALDEENNVQVTIEAPMGSLPSLAEVRLEPIAAEDLREAVDEIVEGSPDILVAMDISFWLGEDEIEPEEPVRVKISAPELEGKTNLQVIHFPDDAEEPETVQLIGDEDLSFALGTNEVAFMADSFSVYVVVDDGSEDDNARLEVNFFNLEHDDENPIATVYIKNSDLYLGNGEREQGKSYIDDIVYDPGIGDGYVLGSNMFRGWTIDAADANPQPQPTEEEPNPDPVPYGANYNRNTKVYTVDDITRYLAGRLGSIQEGQVLNIYAMIFQTYTISYYGNSTEVSMGMHTVFAPLNANAQAPYKIDMTFTPEDNTHFFEGWKVMSGLENIISAVDPDGNDIPKPFYDINATDPNVPTVFPNGATLVVTGDVQFTVSQPEGHWLIFKENGKGATYNAPQFVKNGENTFKPTNATNENMKRKGYTFDGWYELALEYDTELDRWVPQLDEHDNFVFAVTEFTEETQFKFGCPLTTETYIAARWITAQTAPYTVIIWKENIDCDGYDFVESHIINGGTVDSTVNTVSSVGSGTGTYINIDASDDNGYIGTRQYTGFYMKEFDQNVKIAPEGNSVVNVYFDRNEYTLTFRANVSQGYVEVADPDWDAFSAGTVTYYFVDENNDYQTITYRYTDGSFAHHINNGGTSTTGMSNSKNYWAVIGNSAYPLQRHSFNGTTRWGVYYSADGQNYQWIRYDRLANNNLTCSEVLTWSPDGETNPTVYTYRAGGTQTVKTITAKYEQDISGYFPIVGDDGTVYNGNVWDPQNSQIFTTGQVPTLEVMPAESTTFDYQLYGTSGTAHLYYYLECLPGETGDVSYGGKQYTELHHVQISFGQGVNSTKSEDFYDIAGYTQYASDPEYDSNGTVSLNANNNYTIRFYYSRLSYPIVFNDGKCYDGNGVMMNGELNNGQLKITTPILYNGSVASYNADGDDYYTPTRDGFVFAGWFADDACTIPYTFTKMKMGGIQVYAKWIQVQYRVFLRPNVPFSDKSLNWGSEDQGMNFRISEGDYVSTPTGTRLGYIFVGWYYDEDFDDVFDAERVPLTNDNVVDDYDKTDPDYMTDNAKMIPKPTETDPDAMDNKPINKWGLLDEGDAGINKDATKNRFWITKKLDLYAKWKAILDGAEGISVLYDEVPLAEGETEQSGHGVTGSAPGDGGRLYEDNSKAIAQGASKALAEDEQFLYWVVQKWDKDQKIWVDAVDEEKNDIIKVYPGDNFLVKEAYARITPDTQNPGKNFYEVQLRAEYGKKDGPEPTHITWYSNIYDIAGNQFVDTETNSKMTHPTDATWNEDSGWYITQDPVEINNAYAIPTPPYSYEGYTFLGWGRVCDPDSIPEGGKAYVTDPSTLTEEDLYIKWVPATDDAAAHYEAQLPKDKLTRDYYLVGFMNGADNNDGIKIPKSSGKLTITFTQKSYIAVKAPEGNWYKMYNGDFTDPNPTPSSGSANLYDASTNNDQKLPVPAGVQLNITVEELKRDDGSIYGVKLSYTSGSAPSGNVVPLRDGDGEEELEWKTVQYVAADEEKPYHDMYAIWGGEFKVYHSGVVGGAVETYQITRANKELDLTRYYVASRADTDPHAGEYKDSGFLYGGYYLDGGFTAPAMDDKGVPTAECAAYDGANWTWTTPVTDQPGNAITPKGGVTYYIKEVPASKYLQPYFHFSYRKNSDPNLQTLDTAWLISDIDDAMYKETGFVIVRENDKADVCTSLTVETTVGSGTSVKLEAKNIFRKQGVTNGYLSYLEVMRNGQQNLLHEGDTVLQYWVTPDNMIVTGIASRSYGSLTNKTAAKSGLTDATVQSTIGVFSAPAADPEP